MKATGVVRRIDELGRIVIPKEIRKTLRIKEGESLEIYLDNNENILLKKYSSMNQLSDFAQNFTDAINSFTKHEVIITDTDSIIAASGEFKKKYLDQNISEKLSRSITRRENLFEKYEKEMEIIDGIQEVRTYAMNTIVVNGDAIGLVLIFSKDKVIEESDMKLVNITSQILAKYLEE